MNFEEMFARAGERLNKAKVKDVSEHITVQFNVSGEGSGAFYAEIAEGKINVQPYDYKGCDIQVDADSDALVTALESKTADTLSFRGDEAKIAVLKPILAAIPKKVVRKTAAKTDDKPAKKSSKKSAKN